MLFGIGQLSSRQRAGSTIGSCRKRIPGKRGMHKILCQQCWKTWQVINAQLHLKRDNVPNQFQINYLKASFSATEIKLPFFLDSQPGPVTGSKVINWEHLHKKSDLVRTTKGLELYIWWMKKGSKSKNISVGCQDHSHCSATDFSGYGAFW